MRVKQEIVMRSQAILHNSQQLVLHHQSTQGPMARLSALRTSGLRVHLGKHRHSRPAFALKLQRRQIHMTTPNAGARKN